MYLSSLETWVGDARSESYVCDMSPAPAEAGGHLMQQLPLGSISVIADVMESFSSQRTGSAL